MVTADNKIRKRKWDDQGSPNEYEVVTPPNPSDALAAAKLQSTNSNLASPVSNDTSKGSNSIQKQVNEELAKIAANLQAKGINIKNNSSMPTPNNAIALSTSSVPPSSTDVSKGSNSIQQQVNEELAKIAANLQAKGINIKNSNNITTATATTNATSTSATASPIVNSNSDSYNLNDKSSNKGKFFKNVEINDVKNRYMLTKASFLDKLQEETKAEIITRGKYYPNKSMATPKDPPLHLHVAAETQEILDKALEKIQEIIDSAPPVIVHTDTTTSAYHKAAGQTSKRFHQAKVFIGIDDRSFNTKIKLIGIQGANVKHIHRETGARLQLRGKGSGFIEPTSGTEAFEPMFFQISSVTEEGLEKAKQLVDDLIKTVKAEYEKFKQYKGNRPNNPRPHYNTYNQNPYGNTYRNSNMTNPYQAPGYSYPGYTYPPPPPQAGAETAYQAAPPPPLPTATTSSSQTQTAAATTATPPVPQTYTQSYYQAPAGAQGQYSYYYNPYYYYQPPLPTSAPPPPATSNDASAQPPLPSTPYKPSSPDTK